jgi:capsular polysaccharide biosynthesis protein
VSAPLPPQPAGEVRVTEYFRRAARRWYVVVLAVVAAVAIVFLHGVSGATKQSSAMASVYLGQPFTPGGASVLTSTPLSNPNISIQYVTAPQQIAKAADAAGIDNRSLRKHVSVLSSTPSGTGGGKAATGGGPPTIAITVEGPWTRTKVQTAANSLAQSLIDYANRYTDLKARLIADRVKSEQAEMATLKEVQRRAHAKLQAIDQSNAAPLDKVAASSPLVSDLSAAATQIGQLTLNLTNDQVTLVATRDIESAQFISRATGRKVSAATRRSSLVIAAMVGLIVGVGLALAWEALSARPRRAQA